MLLEVSIAMIYSNEHFSVDTTTFRLERDGEPCPLEPQVFDLIVYLIEHRDRVVTREELLDNLWQGRIVSESAINARIKLARKALGDNGKQQKFIKTIHRRGYHFIAAIECPRNPGMPSPSHATQEQPNSGKPSIAVLPFACNSTESTDRDLAEGLSTVVIGNLSCYHELLVIDPESAFAFHQGEDNIVDFATRLGVDYVVNGSVRRAGERLRISAQLIEVEHNKTIWVQRLDRSMADLFDLEDEVASQVAINLVGQIDDKSRARIRFQRPENLTAFDCVVRARPQVESLVQEANLAARNLLLQALELDPGYATVHACLALNHCAEFESDWTEAADDALRRAADYAKQAIAMDQFDSNAHTAMGAVLMFQKNFELAEIHLDQAIECNPNCYNAFCFKSWVLALSGRGAEVGACGETALRLNPLAPDSCLLAIMLAHYTQRKYTEALEILARLQQPYDQSEAFRAACLATLGRDQEARAAVASAIEMGGDAIRQSDWLRGWPFTDPQDRELVIEGLKRSGLLFDKDAASKKPSIAVLQFKHLSADPEQLYFSEGLTTNINSRLSRIRSLQVKIGFNFATENRSHRSIAAELDVDYLLCGAVQREADRVKVSVELVDGDSGTIKWTDTFDRRGTAVIDVQDEIASAIAATLWSYDGTLFEAERERQVRKPTLNFNAFDYILKGIYYKDKYTAAAGRKAHECFDRAIQLDPGSAEAYSWSAWAHIVDISMGWCADPAESLVRAFELARRSVSSDPHSEMGHWALAEAYIMDGDYDNGFREYDWARDINPNNPDIMVTCGTELASYGNWEAGITLIQQGIALNKHHPEWYYWHLGIACFAALQFDRSIEYLSRLSEQNKDSCTYLIACYALTGNREKADRQLTELLQLDPDTTLGEIAQTHAYLHQQAKAPLLEGLALIMRE